MQHSRGNSHPELTKDYERENRVYVYGWKFRYYVCDLPCSSACISIHKSKGHKCDKVQNFVDTLTDKAVKMCKIDYQQALRPVIHCDGESLENVKVPGHHLHR